MRYRARNNPNPIKIVTGNSEQLKKNRQEIADDYRFYARVLKVIYSKPRIRQYILYVMKDLENTKYYLIPDHK